MIGVVKKKPKESVILWPWEIKGPIKGPAVMFDVLAASHNIIHLAQKSRRLFTVTKDSVLDALTRYPDAVLMGEVEDPDLRKKLPFISSNRPSSVLRADVADREVILITNNGTHTLSELIDHGASPVIVGHWINIDAVVAYLRRQKGHSIHLVPSGGRDKIFEKIGGKLMEDWYCAEAAKFFLEGKPYDVAQAFEKSRAFLHGVAPQDEGGLSYVLAVNTTNVVPICYPTSSGIIEVKA